MRALLIPLTLLVIGPTLLAQEIKPGDKVTVIKWDAELKSEKTVVGTSELGQNYVVSKVNGDWLWIASRKGYLNRADVVPYDSAIDHFTKQIRKDPESNVGYHDRAVVWVNRGEFDSAIGDYNEAIRLHPSGGASIIGRGLAWSSKREFDNAIADFTKAIRLEPKLASGYANRGDTWHDRQDYAKAIDDFSEVIRLEPKHASAFYARGHALSHQQEYDRAILDFTEAIRLNPDLVDAYVERGDSWWLTQQYERAIADRKEALRLNPQSITAYNSIAWELATCPDEKNRNGKIAIVYATKACELSNWKDSSKIDTLAAAYAEAGDFENAVKRQSEAMRLASEAAKADYQSRLTLYESQNAYRDRTPIQVQILKLNRQGDVALRGKYYSQARTWFEEAIKLDAKNAHALTALAESHFLEGRYEDTLTACVRALEFGDESGALRHLRGNALAKLNRPKEAISDYSRGLELSPDLRVCYADRALQFDKIGELDFAIVDYTVALHFAKNDQERAEILHRRGTVWLKRGDEATAVADYAQSARLKPGHGELWRTAAWILATSLNDEVRNAHLAVTYARNDFNNSATPSATQFDTLAAAYAESGEFTFAAVLEGKAIAKLDTEQQAALKPAFESRLELYKANKPYRETRPEYETKVEPNVAQQ